MAMLSNNGFVFFDDEHQMFAPSVVSAPAPRPVAQVAVGGGSGLAPWEPLYADPKSCSTYGIPQAALEKIIRGSGGKKTSPDPLEVLRDVQKTQERVKRSELRALRKTVATLQQEKAQLTAEGAAKIAEAAVRIQALEYEVACLRTQTKNLEAKVSIEKWKMAPWKPYRAPKRPAAALAVKEAPILVALPVQDPQGGAADAVLAALPYAAASAAAAILTAWVVPADAKALKAAGYIAAAMGLAAALGAGARAYKGSSR